MSRVALPLVAFALLGCATASPQKPSGPAPQQAQRPAGTPAGGSASAGPAAAAKSPYKEFGELTKGATVRTGFFDTYEKDGRVYMAIPKDRLGEEFLMTYQIAQGVGARFLFGGLMLLRDANVMTLERKGDKIFLVQQQHRFTAPEGSAIAKAVDLTFGNSIIEQAKIESFRGDSAIVIDVHDWFVSDLSQISEAVKAAVAPRPGQPGRATLDKSRSFLEEVKVFPNNVNFRAKLTFNPGETVFINSVPDSRYLPISVHYSLIALPDEPMATRAADDRTGFFMAVRKDFSRDDHPSYFVRFASRWRLECAAPAAAGELCDPKKPITYYLDPNIPEEYRPHVKAGILAWNSAFEAAGFRNAVRAEMLPDSADAADVRYATLRWNTSDEPAYGAIGPRIFDPRTGEILDADILFESSMIQGYKSSWRTVASPAVSLKSMFEASEDELAYLAAGGESAMFASEMTSQGALLRTMLAARGEMEPNTALGEQFVGQAIAWVVMHEVGHTLGLRHNFRSSADTPLEKLHDAGWTKEKGVYSSVMDYPSINLALPGVANGEFYNTGVGSSDRWMIAYGYTPDDAKAAELARQAAEAGHAYGTDEDARGPGALDPTVNVYDLGGDPLAWGKERAALIQSLIPTLPALVLTDNARHADLTNAFNTLMNQYVRAVGTGVKYIGGQYQYRDHVGDPDARAPFVNVPKAKQREALQFMNQYAFAENALVVPRSVLSQLGANRWSHWGEQNTFNGRIDFPLGEQVIGVQTALLAQVTHPLVFARIRDAEVKFGAAEVLTIPELMASLTQNIFGEVTGGSPRNISGNRRELQRAYVDRLGDLVLNAPDRTPADARSVARLQLASLKRQIDARSSASGLDVYTRAHLAEASARIGEILTAGTEFKK